MKPNNIYTLQFKRKRKSLTDYRKRLKILSSNKPRLVVRKSLKNIQAYLIEYNKNGDSIKICSHSSNLKKFGWNYGKDNIPAAYLVGLLLGKKAKSANISEAVLDIGLNKSVSGSMIYAVLAGALDSGLKVPHGKEILPSRERLNGTHIANYAILLKKDPVKFKNQFGYYLKNNMQPEDIVKK